MKISLIPAFDDNYIFHILTDDGLSAVVDPGDAAPVVYFLEEQDLPLNVILHTHHHWDHINGDKKLKNKYDCEIWGPEYEILRIPDMDVLFENEELYNLGAHTFKAIHTPGHTRGHTCLYFENENVLFSGDTLFSLGCGRLFEGTPAEMWNSLEKIRALSDETMVYCAHEYTNTNAEFLKSIEPNNSEIETIIENSKKTPTIPSRLEFEKKYNPFLRAEDQQLLKAMSIEDKSPEDAFAIIRKLRDNFG